MSVSRLFHALFGSDELAFRALRRRAERHFRTALHELRYIVYEALKPEIEAIRAEPHDPEPQGEVRSQEKRNFHPLR